MGDSGRAETEQALYGYTSRENEREQDRPAYHYATTRSFGRRKLEIKIKKVSCTSLYGAISTSHSLNDERN